MSTSARLERLREIVRRRSVVTDSQQRIVSPLGDEYRWMVDLRPALLDGETLEICAGAFWDRFGARLPFQIGGLEFAAVPLIAAIAGEGWRRGTPVNAFVVRRERKAHGLCRRIEGEVREEPIVAVDDLVNRGSALDTLRCVLAEAGRDVAALFVVVDFRHPELHERLGRCGIALDSLLAISDLGLTSLPAPEPRPRARFDIVWRSRAGEPNYFHVVPKSTPVLDGTCLYAGSDDGTFRAFDLASGAERWRLRTDDPRRKGIFSSPALHTGRVYFGAYDGCVRCLDCGSGDLVWRFSGADWIGSSPALAPAIGRLFIGLEHASPRFPGGIAALDMAGGEKLWELRCSAHVHGTPLWMPELQAVACGGNDGRMRRLDARDGSESWSYAAGGEIKARAAFDRHTGQLVFGAFDGGIHAVDVAGGERRWRVGTHDIVYSTPLLVGRRAFVAGADKYLHVIDLDAGEEEAALFTGAKLYGSPALIEGRVLFGNTAGELYEIDPDTLRVTAFAQLPEGITCEVRYGGQHRLYFVTTYDNEVFALRREEGRRPGVRARAPPDGRADSAPALETGH